MRPGRLGAEFRQPGLVLLPSLRQVVFRVARHFARFPPHQKGVDERIDISVEHAVHVADRQFGAVILDQPVGGEYIAADLAAEIDFELGIFELLIFGALLGTSAEGLAEYILPTILIILGGYFVVRFFMSRPTG